MSYKSVVLLGAIAFAILHVACEEADLKAACDNPVIATVRDLSGLDGCGYVFELADGTRLQPEMIGYCGVGPLPKVITENPLYDFEWLDGKQVKIGFTELPDAVSICMAGKIVNITCIEELVSITRE